MRKVACLSTRKTTQRGRPLPTPRQRTLRRLLLQLPRREEAHAVGTDAARRALLRASRSRDTSACAQKARPFVNWTKRRRAKREKSLRRKRLASLRRNYPSRPTQRRTQRRRTR